jgi:hypothetical protein
MGSCWRSSAKLRVRRRRRVISEHLRACVSVPAPMNPPLTHCCDGKDARSAARARLNDRSSLDDPRWTLDHSTRNLGSQSRRSPDHFRAPALVKFAKLQTDPYLQVSISAEPISTSGLVLSFAILLLLYFCVVLSLRCHRCLRTWSGSAQYSWIMRRCNRCIMTNI